MIFYKDTLPVLGIDVKIDIFKDIIPSILQTKKNVLENESDYNSFVVNKALSFHRDCVLYANEMNKVPNLDSKLQYLFLINIIRGYKRPYQKWLKRETMSDLDAIKEYYNYSNSKAREAMLVLSSNQIIEIKKVLNKGGLNDKSRRTGGGNASGTR